ncbi:MAG: lytic transglycosylase domain-containing protein [Myxococcales bacterium]|nr:lytic transglycosylase domain-containing protein [Myxococcales bacterium]
MPTGCDWRRASAPAPMANQTIELTAATVATTPVAAVGAASAAVGPRDPGGRLGPTPAPVAEGNPLDPRAPYAAEVAAAALRYKLPVELVRAVMQVESGNSPIALSHRGAVGLMQLLPETGKAMGVTDLYDPAQNVAGGARFLRVLANRFQGDLVKVLSAYHAGSARVQTREATPFAATDDYVRKVLRLYYQLRDAADRSRAAPPAP